MNNNFQQAVQALNNNQYRKAEELCLPLLKFAPKNPDILHLLALSTKQQNRWDDAAKYFEKSLKANKKQPAVISNFANLRVVMNERDKANKLFQQALELDPINLEILYNYAANLNQQNKPNKAIKTIKRALQLNNKNPNFYTLLGNSLENLEKHNDALEAYSNALEIAPNDFYALFGKGVTYRKMKQPNDAIRCYLKIQEQGKAIPQYLFNLACAYYDTDDFKQTEILLKQSIEIDANYVDAHEALNKLYWEQSSEDKFLLSYKSKIPHATATPQLHFSYAAQLILAKDSEKAKEVLQTAIKQFGNLPDFTHALAILIGREGDFDNAIPLVNSALKLSPENTRYRIDMANILIQQENYKSALKHLNIAHKFAPLNQEIWAYKGICWRLLNDEREHWLNNYDQFIGAKILDTPDGYDNFEHFLHQYTQVINQLHKTVKQPLDQSVMGGSQTVGHLLQESSKVISDYESVLRKRIREYILGLPKDPKHPFLSRIKNSYKIEGCWSVRLSSEGFHTNHVHPEGWFSGPTYISVPNAMSPDDKSKAGWVKFGESSLNLGDREQIALEVCPEPGLCVFFPSYIWHGTHPFHSSEYRMTSPCDIMPVN